MIIKHRNANAVLGRAILPVEDFRALVTGMSTSVRTLVLCILPPSDSGSFNGYLKVRICHYPKERKKFVDEHAEAPVEASTRFMDETAEMPVTVGTVRLNVTVERATGMQTALFFRNYEMDDNFSIQARVRICSPAVDDSKELRTGAVPRSFSPVFESSFDLRLPAAAIYGLEKERCTVLLDFWLCNQLGESVDILGTAKVTVDSDGGRTSQKGWLPVYTGLNVGGFTFVNLQWESIGDTIDLAAPVQSSTTMVILVDEIRHLCWDIIQLKDPQQGMYRVSYTVHRGNTINSKKYPEVRHVIKPDFTTHFVEMRHRGMVDELTSEDVEVLLSEQLEVLVWRSATSDSPEDLVGSAFVDLQRLRAMNQSSAPRWIGGCYPLLHPLKSDVLGCVRIRVMMDTAEVPLAVEDDGAIGVTLNASPERISPLSDLVHVFHAEVVEAMHLSFVPGVHRTIDRVPPRCFVTLEWNGTMSESSKVAPSSLSPSWKFGKEFFAERSAEVTRLVRGHPLLVRLWHRSEEDSSEGQLLGVASVDLSPLLTGLEQIHGWYHIVDPHARRHGQVLVRVTPKQFLLRVDTSVRNTVRVSSPPRMLYVDDQLTNLQAHLNEAKAGLFEHLQPARLPGSNGIMLRHLGIVL